MNIKKTLKSVLICFTRGFQSQRCTRNMMPEVWLRRCEKVFHVIVCSEEDALHGPTCVNTACLLTCKSVTICLYSVIHTVFYWRGLLEVSGPINEKDMDLL